MLIFLTQQNKNKSKVTSWRLTSQQRNFFSHCDTPGDVTVDARVHNMHTQGITGVVRGFVLLFDSLSSLK